MNNLENTKNEITKFWYQESTCIKDTEFRITKDKVQEIFYDTLWFKNGIYEVSLPTID